jgi:hypothetical protein
VFPVSTMMLLKYLIRAPMRDASMFKSCHGSFRTNRCVDLIVSEILCLKTIYPDLLCLLWRFSLGYFKLAAQNSCQWPMNNYYSIWNNRKENQSV